MFMCTIFFSFIANTAQAVVVSSVRPIGFIVAAIADGVTSTEILLPDGASPHDYALRPNDAKRLQSADLLILVGPGMESFIMKQLASRSISNQIILANLPAIQSELIKESEHYENNFSKKTEKKYYNYSAERNTRKNTRYFHGDYNMHIWLSPEIAKQTAIVIHEKLLKLMPQKRVKLDENLLNFTDQLTQTEEKIVNILESIKGKGYFVFHGAYGYFEKRFGLNPLGYFTINPAIQPGAQRLHQIRTQLVEKKAVCIFTEPQFKPAVINTVVKGMNVRIGVLDPLGSNIELNKDSYTNFLLQLSNQYSRCLEKRL